MTANSSVNYVLMQPTESTHCKATYNAYTKVTGVTSVKNVLIRPNLAAYCTLMFEIDMLTHATSNVINAPMHQTGVFC